MKDLQNDNKIYHILRYYNIFICKNPEIPWKNHRLHQKLILSSKLFSIFNIYIYSIGNVMTNFDENNFSRRIMTWRIMIWWLEKKSSIKNFNMIFEVSWRRLTLKDEMWRHVTSRQIKVSNQFFFKKIFFSFLKFKKLILKSVEANFVSKCFIFILIKYIKRFLKKFNNKKNRNKFQKLIRNLHCHFTSNEVYDF